MLQSLKMNENNCNVDVINFIHEVRSGTTNDRDDIVETLVTAFMTDPLVQLLHPNPIIRKEKLNELFNETIDNSDDDDDNKLVIDVTTTLNGCAIWHPPTVEPDLDPSPTSRQEVFNFFHTIKSIAPKNESFWYLAYIGTRSNHGSGVGTTLLKHRLSLIKEGLVALWTGNEENIKFYQKFGFEVYSHCEVNALQAWWLTYRMKCLD